MGGSDCKWAGSENADGLRWCEIKQIHVTREKCENCDCYESK